MSGKGSPPPPERWADSRKEERDEGRSGVVGRDREVDRARGLLSAMGCACPCRFRIGGCVAGAVGTSGVVARVRCRVGDGQTAKAGRGCARASRCVCPRARGQLWTGRPNKPVHRSSLLVPITGVGTLSLKLVLHGSDSSPGQPQLNAVRSAHLLWRGICSRTCERARASGRGVPSHDHTCARSIQAIPGSISKGSLRGLMAAPRFVRTCPIAAHSYSPNNTACEAPARPSNERLKDVGAKVQCLHTA